jgi:hypothetical protein
MCCYGEPLVVVSRAIEVPYFEVSYSEPWHPERVMKTLENSLNRILVGANKKGS